MVFDNGFSRITIHKTTDVFLENFPVYTRFQLFSNADVVYGFGLLDKDRRHLYDSQGVMIQAAILLEKKTYVYDEDKKQWYVARIYKQKNKKGGWKVWHRFVACKQPHGFLNSVCFYDPQTPQETLDLMDTIQLK